MKVTFSSKQEALRIEPAQVTALVEGFCVLHKIECEEIILHFVSKDSITILHANFFNDPTPTDCITFPIDPPSEMSEYRILGELFICPEVAKEYSKDHNIDPYEELTLYVIHGLLHLIGYRDTEQNDIDEMRAMEAYSMDKLKAIQLKQSALV